MIDKEILKAKFITALRDTGRKGIDNLIIAMEQGGFFEAPCSGKKAYHLAEEGGLLKHSMNVLDYSKRLNKAFDYPVPDESIIIAALLHDLGKMGDYGKHYYVENILKTGQSQAEPFKHNTELLYIPHEIKSVKIASEYIRLTEDEEHAITFHNGLYSKLGSDVNGKETWLYMILHTADMVCSRFVEANE